MICEFYLERFLIRQHCTNSSIILAFLISCLHFVNPLVFSYLGFIFIDLEDWNFEIYLRIRVLYGIMLFCLTVV